MKAQKQNTSLQLISRYLHKQSDSQFQNRFHDHSVYSLLNRYLRHVHNRRRKSNHLLALIFEIRGFIKYYF